ncbi:MAG: sugar phosphate isomerase/epimerase [Proteobacteria bacterium]|nr:sugar phosphate isomerase/epimerase [Pseudomonadota bacterium]MBU4296794.1 sugar phosphate isomerase/epimerase [Pseudomonadota bacterium]MCG2749024.1 sugar phosphate isomerase/epimerase [Desulfobulbaceae bacterium]
MVKIKGRYPWRIGATSFVIPAGIEENVRYLADRVDDIQLLFFESPSQCRLPQQVDVHLLQGLAQEHDLSYTVHLPSDIQPGSSDEGVRQQAIAEIIRLMAQLAQLSPLCYDLHLALQPELAMGQWLGNIDEFLRRLRHALGRERAVVAIENIDYPFSLVRPLVREHGFALCADIGHGLLYGEDQNVLFADIGKAAHIHYHGLRGGRDHQALGAEQQACSKRLGHVLHAVGFTGVLTLEVYRSADLQASLQHIAESWLHYQQ